jgi:two-component system sensor histidine kinase KdpD
VPLATLYPDAVHALGRVASGSREGSEASGSRAGGRRADAPRAGHRLARLRPGGRYAREAAERRAEVDLAVEMARLLLGGRLERSLRDASARLAQALGLASAAIQLGPARGDERHAAFPLRDRGRQVATLIIPAATPAAKVKRLRERVVPALETLLGAALERDSLQGEVVETAALRRADAVKTAVLRAVSHDLRSPLTAIATAGEAIGLERLSPQERRELASVICEETRRLARLVENLLDVSRLEAGAAVPRLDWTAVDEVIRAAISEPALREHEIRLLIDGEPPLVRADPAQLERAFVNVLENACRHSAGAPVVVRVRALRGGDPVEPGAHAGGGRLIVRVVDHGPGIPAAEIDRVFEPFYHGRQTRGDAGPDGVRNARRKARGAVGRRVGPDRVGSGLGLAIARGFTEANGGVLRAESLPGQGATFVFELPLAECADTGHSLPEPCVAKPAAVDDSSLATTAGPGFGPARADPAPAGPAQSGVRPAEGSMAARAQ